MNYVLLGRSALKISRLCLGTMMFGGPTDEAAARNIVAAARDGGVNFIDTADVYTGGQSEILTGRCIAADRDRWVLATKLGNPMGDGTNQGGQSRKWIIESTEASLKRLGTDYIDILYLHRPCGDDGLPEAIRAFGDLIRQGKIRYFAISNFSAWRLGLICQLADQFAMDRPVAIQPVYSIVDRTAERELVPTALHYGVGVVSYSPLARGILTGKYTPKTAPDPDSRAGRGDMRILQTEYREESIEIARRIGVHAAERGLSTIDFAMGWVLANRGISAVIGGPRTEAQWQTYLKAADVRIGSEDEALIDSLVARGHPSTPGYNDPAYPIEGRVIG